MTEDKDKILCPACKTEVAEDDNKCPNCGVEFQDGVLEDGIKTKFKFTRIVILAVIVIALLSGGGLAYQAYQQSSIYNQALALLSNHKWDEALADLSQLQGYKNENELTIYANANKQMAGNYDSTDGTNQILTTLSGIPDNYQGDLNKDITKLRQKVQGHHNDLVNQKEQADEAKKEQVIAQVTPLINNVQFLDAMNILDQAYPNYNGELDGEIDISNYLVAEQWQKFENQHKQIYNPAPTVGMTADEVKQDWGEPDKINTTTTLNGTSEQWIYNNTNTYVYLDNGVVTAVQN